jgi:hypothetical protein
LQNSLGDETLAWRAATVVMMFVTALTVALKLLGLGPFTDVFDLFIVYLPTAILMGRIVFQRFRGTPGQIDDVTSGPLTVENKGV